MIYKKPNYAKESYDVYINYADKKCEGYIGYLEREDDHSYNDGYYYWLLTHNGDIYPRGEHWTFETNNKDEDNIEFVAKYFDNRIKEHIELKIEYYNMLNECMKNDSNKNTILVKGKGEEYN